MKDYLKQVLTDPFFGDVSGHHALHRVRFCLEQLYADEEHNTSDDVVDGLTFEELLGALISAQNRLEEDEEIL